MWTGTTSTGYQANLVILENGETWGIYSSSNYVVGAVYGNTSSTSTALSGTGSLFNLVSRTVGNASYSGTYAVKSSISVSVSDGTKFTGAYSSLYDQAASLATLAGTYTGWAVTGGTAAQTTAVNIDANGSVSSSYVSGTYVCTTSGKATPRNTAKNVFNLQLSFSGNACALGNGSTVTGVATYDSAAKRLIAMGLNAAKSDGFIYLASR